MEIIDNQALRLKLRSEIISQITGYIPKSAADGDHAIVYWGQQETEALIRVVDLPDVPSPMLRDYTWTGMFTPMEHQRSTASFLSLRPRAFCFSEAGTGKTAASIWAADYLMNLGLVQRVLIICPLSIMYSAWQSDLFKTAPHRSHVVAYASTAVKRKEIIQQNHEFTVINYDGVYTCLEEINAKKYDLIIVDEANHYKSASTKRWRTLAKLIQPSTRLWMMTGTPAAQSPVDAFGLAKLVCPARVPKFFTAWRDSVMWQKSRFTWLPRPDHKDRVYKALQPAIRYTKEQCLDLPEVVYQTRTVPISVQVARYYKELKRELLIQAAGQEISAVNAGVALNKLLQLSGGAVYTDTGAVVEFDVSDRLQALSEVLDECNRKVVIFIPYLHSIQIVDKYLMERGYSTAVITGQVGVIRRKEIIKSFQEQEEPRVLICQPATMSHGVTLTAADTLIFWGPILSVETYLQCIARIDRIGQTAKMLVVRILGSEVEKKIYRMLDTKVSNHRGLVELYQSVMEDTSL